MAWTLSDGDLHVTDASNAGVTGLIHGDGIRVEHPACSAALRIPEAVLPDIVDSSGAVGSAEILAGAPPIAGIAGDQQASLIGQCCTRPGSRQGHLRHRRDARPVHRSTRPLRPARGPAGTIPIIAWRRAGTITWGIEAIMLSAGTCVEWLRDDLGIIDDAADSAEVAGRCDDTGDVWFVPALLGLGTPVWDFGARGTFTGLTRGSGRPELVRAVLEGVAHRGADLLEAAETDSGLPIAFPPGRRWDDGQPRCSPRRSPMPADGPSRSPPCSRPPPWARRSWPAWPWHLGRRGRGGRGMDTAPGGRAPPSATTDGKAARARWLEARSPVRGAPSPSCPPSTSEPSSRCRGPRARDRCRAIEPQLG